MLIERHRLSCRKWAINFASVFQVEHFDLKRMYAERLLKKHGGDMKKTVHELLLGSKTTAINAQQPSSNESHVSQSTK